MFKFLFGRKKQPKLAEKPALFAAAKPEDVQPAPPTAPVLSGGGGGIHIPAHKLSRRNLHLHYAINSLREELEAVDWYRQRADDTEDAELKAILLHNADEEIEHAAMILEWIRRREPRFDKELKEYLFTDGPIVEVEKKAMGRE
ncbi:ferritin-like protein [Rhizomicrobium palustre]|uniref:Ferritin-like protein n=1 Tax=Rhizomicrobium palustre TaxID=189966 RepID=A0A846MZU7_9PROT|nr:ferritin family protein [Rhizomicrobium palustre]NIK88833.1 ferritin-like protein [Rhizomicrobium palustre]